ncbi:beta-lactamase/transpeptidase-like protein [Xylariaceae sp. FL0594]|nr:beta-lactamase/transpeptidase-like protein [Xylariaceae sp. FL0594]
MSHSCVRTLTDRSIGNILYSKSFGKSTLREGTDIPFTTDTICGVASMTKLMTAVSVLQCVEGGILDLDQDVRDLVPGFGRFGIITGVDGDDFKLEPNTTPVTPRMLLCHTSGQVYEFIDPVLGKWRASRGEIPFGGATVHEKCSIPLSFAPGTAWAYGGGCDWAGKVVEAVTKTTLEEYMKARIWTPLGIERDASFFPRNKEGMKDRMAEWATLSETGEPPAVYLPDFDANFGSTECLGGGGLSISTKGYYAFLSALFRRDARILKPASYDELFRPQLDERCEDALNEYFYRSEQHTAFLALCIPPSARKSWSLAGLVIKEGQEGRFGRGAVSWAGVPSVQWYMDQETGVCGVAVCQILPPMLPPVMSLHDKAQKIVFDSIRCD